MNLKNNIVLVTGGAGFIGSELVRQLADARNRVIAVDNLVNGKRDNLAGLPADLVRLEVTDIRDTDRMNALLRGVDAVFHLACLGVRHSIHSPIENHEVNAGATLRLLLAARAADVKRFVYVSSSEVYGTAIRVPMTEEHPAFPMTVYGSGKLAGECYTRAFHRTYGYATVVVRPFNTYGPRCHHEGDSGEVIPKFLLRSMAGKPMVIFGDGTQTRDFTFVSDTARGIILAGTADAAIGATINVGSGFEITVNALADEVRAVLRNPSAPVMHEEPRPGDVLRLYADVTKARQLTGFAPTVTLREGLEKLLAWYQASGKTPEELLRDEIVKNWIKP
jgi:UDP-glucose 4-epimerase